MRRARCVGGLLLVAASAAPAFGADAWAVPGASFRMALEREAGSPWPAPVGHVRVWPGSLPATNCAIRVIADGVTPVAARVLWAATGEPVQVLFDTSGSAARYEVYAGGDPAPDAAGWEPRAGLVLETRPWIGGKYPELLAQWREQWAAAAPVLGRSVVPRVFDGIHPHGPSTNFLSRYEGWLDIKAAGDYEFATLSDFASFLQVDDRPVVAWGGDHWAGGGLYGEHSGGARLAAGPHKFEYLHVHGPGDAIAAAAWRRPGQNRFEIIPPEAFVPLARFRTPTGSGRDAARSALIEWEPVEQAAAGGVTLVTLELRVRAAAGVDGARWAFDDGLNAEGVTVRHVFARPGLHNVRVAAMPKGGQTCEADATIRVRPRWLQPEECPADVVIRQRELVLGYALDRLAIGDLAAVTVFADAAQERGWAIALGDALLARRSELKGGAAEALYRLALQYQHPEVRRYDVAEQAFRLVAGLPDAPPALAAQAALHYAGYLVHALGRPEEAAPRLAGVQTNLLSAYDLRLRDIYVGDVALALGQVDKARAQYTATGLVDATPDVGYFVRRRARLEQATDSLAKRDYESVETIIRTIEWERPVERMATRTGFPLIEAFLGQKAYPFALGRCLLIQQARPPEEHEAQLLFYLVEIHQALGQKANAAAALHRLLKEHPLSEPAARAKERFRGLIQVSAG